MSKLGFFADVIETGTVMGLDANMGPEAATTIMGTNCAENLDNSTFWRDYGLVEISWRKRKRNLGWEGQHFTVQAHRLDPLVTFGELQHELTRRGVRLADLGTNQYWQPESQVTVQVDHGSVQRISSAFGWTQTTVEIDQKTAWQQLKAIADLSDAERTRWVERKRPDDFAPWWRYLCRLTAQYVSTWYDVPDRPKFIALAEWLWRHGLEREALTPQDVALARAEFVANLDEWHPELATGHDERVQDCLKNLNGTMDRNDKNLIDAAYKLRPKLQDATALDEAYEQRLSRR